MGLPPQVSACESSSLSWSNRDWVGELGMTAKKYQTIAEINRIIADDMREAVSLEYKSSTILNSKGIGAICKTVSALSNSAGGQFIIGIESKDGKPVRLDGGFSGPSKLDWLHQIIN